MWIWPDKIWWFNRHTVGDRGGGKEAEGYVFVDFPLNAVRWAREHILLVSSFGSCMLCYRTLRLYVHNIRMCFPISFVSVTILHHILICHLIWVPVPELTFSHKTPTRILYSFVVIRQTDGGPGPIWLTQNALSHIHDEWAPRKEKGRRDA